jgi:prepilin-type N-terminal cleavage/methylation domain-containing protein
MKILRNKEKGFTLIEILVVIGILAVLLAIVLIAINPQQQFQQANDTQRRSDVNAVLNAISSYAAQNKGQLPAGITGTAKPLKLSDPVVGTELDLCAALVPTYIADLPLDPTLGVKDPDTGAVCAADTYTTGYTVQSAAGNRVTVTATPEGADPISVTR